jgi:hypothetical protein
VRVGRNAPIRGSRNSPKTNPAQTSAHIRKAVKNFGNRVLPGNPFG